MYEEIAFDGPHEVASLAMNIYAREVAACPVYLDNKELRRKAKLALEASVIFFGVLNEAAEVAEEPALTLAPAPSPAPSISIPPHPFKTGDRIRLKDEAEVVMTFHEMLIRNDMVVARVYDGARTFWYPIEDIEHVPEVIEEPKLRVGDMVRNKDIPDGPKMMIMGFAGSGHAHVSWEEMNTKYDLTVDTKNLKRV